jgi:hypothetical protein
MTSLVERTIESAQGVGTTLTSSGLNEISPRVWHPFVGQQPSAAVSESVLSTDGFSVQGTNDKSPSLLPLSERQDQGFAEESLDTQGLRSTIQDTKSRSSQVPTESRSFDRGPREALPSAATNDRTPTSGPSPDSSHGAQRMNARSSRVTLNHSVAGQRELHPNSSVWPVDDLANLVADQDTDAGQALSHPPGRRGSEQTARTVAAEGQRPVTWSVEPLLLDNDGVQAAVAKTLAPPHAQDVAQRTVYPAPGRYPELKPRMSSSAAIEAQVAQENELQTRVHHEFLASETRRSRNSSIVAEPSPSSHPADELPSVGVTPEIPRLVIGTISVEVLSPKSTPSPVAAPLSAAAASRIGELRRPLSTRHRLAMRQR